MKFGTFLYRVTACHVVTYFLIGILAYAFLDYRGLFQSEALSQYMRPIDSPVVAAGPAPQVVRGLILSLALWAFRQVFLDSPGGRWKLFGLLIGLSVLSTSGPSPSSFEGVLYTRLSWQQHLRGFPELLLQNLAFVWILAAWCNRPRRAVSITMGVLFALAILMSLAGFFFPRPEAFRG